MDKEYIQSLIKADIESLGCVIWGIELVGNNNSPTLRVFIDRNKGIRIQDCEKVSRHISKVLEADEFSINNLSLEVSSPGVQRKFFNKNQYSNYIGFTLKVRYKKEENEYTSIKGTLEEVIRDGLVLKTENEDFFINFNSIDKANLEYTGVEHAK